VKGISKYESYWPVTHLTVCLCPSTCQRRPGQHHHLSSQATRTSAPSLKNCSRNGYRQGTTRSRVIFLRYNHSFCMAQHAMVGDDSFVYFSSLWLLVCSIIRQWRFCVDVVVASLHFPPAQQQGRISHQRVVHTTGMVVANVQRMMVRQFDWPP
jgi:hypothetical protein